MQDGDTPETRTQQRAALAMRPTVSCVSKHARVSSCSLWLPFSLHGRGNLRGLDAACPLDLLLKKGENAPSYSWF